MAEQLRNAYGHILKPYYSTGNSLPMLIGVTDMNGEHPYIPKREWIDERNAHVADNAKLKQRIADLEQLVRDMWEFGENSNYPYTPLESVRWGQMREEYQERIVALGVEVN